MITKWRHSRSVLSGNPDSKELDARLRTLDYDIRGQASGMTARRCANIYCVMYNSIDYKTFIINQAIMTKEELLNKLKDLEQRLSKAEVSARQYRDALDAIGDAISIQDTDFKILYQNQAGKKIKGDHAGKSCYKAYANKEVVCIDCPVAMTFHDGMNHTAEQISTDSSGETVYIEIAASPLKDETGNIVACVETVKNINERNKIGPELIKKMQKLESLSIFASGLAHEYNNLLTAIIGNLSLAKMYAKPGYEVYDVLTEAEKASARAKDLTSQLLLSTEGSITSKKTIYLKKSLRDWVESALKASQVKADFSIQEDLHNVEADELQLRHVIDNVVANARQSMPGGGVIEIRAENMTIDSPSLLPLKKGEYVMISIKDHGTGIPEERLLNIYDPLSETKQKDSRLDLAGFYSIIRKHHGHITADSKPGIGTIFHIYLPASQKEIPSSAAALKTYPSGRGRILVMDDEEIIRLVINKLLSQCGFETTLAGNGNEMLKMYKTALESGQPFNAVILDLAIEGGMGGQEAIKYLLEMDPYAKAIVSSGYSNAPAMSNYKEFGFIGFLAKPYKLEELGNLLDKILSETQ